MPHLKQLGGSLIRRAGEDKVSNMVNSGGSNKAANRAVLILCTDPYLTTVLENTLGHPGTSWDTKDGLERLR